ncbi:hypothetical protein GCM10022255_089140 [Dactylosporangium darangshiense]|uniref:Uncharacterized protein n=2 Tax=Dactylosporangium darangshiense TaxID=579108 RepID=A0ABP8DNP7_9ACTN
MLAVSVRMGWGAVYVVAPHLMPTFIATLEGVAQQRTVSVLPVDDRDWRQVHQAVLRGAESGAIVVLTGRHEFPVRLAEVVRIFNKGDGLVHTDGGTRSGYGSPDFLLVSLMTPQAWRTIDAVLRDRLMQSTSTGILCYLESTDRREHVGVLELARWNAAKDPIWALKRAASLDERHRLVVDLFPPHQNGTFESQDEALKKLIGRLTEDHDQNLQQDLLEILVSHHDFYLVGLALRDGWPARAETLDRLATAMAQTPYIGGQRAHYWELMREMAERGNVRIRELMESLLSRDGPSAENVLHVLSEIRPWPTIVDRTIALAGADQDVGVQDLCRKILRQAYLSGVRPSKPSDDVESAPTPYGIPDSVSGLLFDDYQHYLATGVRMLRDAGAPQLERELTQLARFQAVIQDLPVGSYPKSIRTFVRAVGHLLNCGSWQGAVDASHLTSTRSSSPQYKLMLSELERLAR